MPTLLKISYTKGERSVEKYVLDCIGWNPQSGKDLVGLDVTREVRADLSKDRKEGFEPEKGRSFGFFVYQALRAGEAHEEVSSRWLKARSQGDSTDFRPKIGFPGIWKTFKPSRLEILGSWK